VSKGEHPVPREEVYPYLFRDPFFLREGAKRNPKVFGTLGNFLISVGPKFVACKKVGNNGFQEHRIWPKVVKVG